MQSLVGYMLTDKDVEPPTSIKEVQSMLCKDSWNEIVLVVVCIGTSSTTTISLQNGLYEERYDSKICRCSYDGVLADVRHMTCEKKMKRVVCFEGYIDLIVFLVGKSTCKFWLIDFVINLFL